MNERIRLLAEQCYHRYSEHNVDLEKFAELIVRECANIDFRFKVGMTTDQESDTGRVILEHFDLK